MPCSDSTACYAIVQPKALNQGYVLSKNGSGVWYRADSYKLMKQSAYNNQYLNVSDNIAVLAIGYDSELTSYYSGVAYGGWSERGYGAATTYGVVQILTYAEFHFGTQAMYISNNFGIPASCTTMPFKTYCKSSATVGFKTSGSWFYDSYDNFAWNIVKYDLIQ